MTYTFSRNICIIGAPNNRTRFENFSHEVVDEKILMSLGIPPRDISGTLYIVRLYNDSNNVNCWVVLGKNQFMSFAFQATLCRKDVVVGGRYSSVEKITLNDVIETLRLRLVV